MPNESATMPVVSTASDLTPAGFGSMAAFKLLYRAGELLASSALVPDVYRDKPADCALIIEISQRIDASPLMVANNLDIIHGRPSWRSQFLIASVNRCRRFSALRYEWRGKQGEKEWGCRTWAKELVSGDRLDGVWIDWKLVEAEGWSTKKGSKWLTMPEQMFIYRAAAFWTRAYAPDIALGFPTTDEMHDVIDVTPMREVAAPESSVDRAKAQVREALRTPPPASTGATPPDAAAEPQKVGTVSFAQVAEQLRAAGAAKNVDNYNEAVDLIRHIPDATQRTELSALAEEIRKVFA